MPADSLAMSYFLAFCIEQYKQAKGLSGEQAMRTLSQHGVLDYLSEHYDVLHTQGHRWLVEEMDELVSAANKEA